MSEEAWESSVHRGELIKCGKEKKHDQSSRSSAMTVNHTRAPQARDRDRVGKVRWRGGVKKKCYPEEEEQAKSE